MIRTNKLGIIGMLFILRCFLPLAPFFHTKSRTKSLRRIVRGLPGIRLIEGYRYECMLPDWENVGDETIPYACEQSMPTLYGFSEEKGVIAERIVKDKTSGYFPIEDMVKFKFTKSCIFSMALIMDMANVLPKVWHVQTYFYRTGCLDRVIKIINKEYGGNICGDEYGFRDSDGYDRLVAFNNDYSLLPKVTILDRNHATLEVCVWSDWGGLYKSKYEIVREGNHLEFNCTDIISLVEYDCGIMY